MPVSDAMRQIILDRLHEIAREENALILFAAESGSRAWGFHSEDSDYDVRFIYARPVSWHLSLGKKRDVIERPIDDELDLSGWELGKALNLALGSNAVIAEWLQSPIVYGEHSGFRAEISAFCKSALTRKSVTWHYVNLTARQLDHLHTPEGSVRLKRYLYCLRPALALRWMRMHDQAMPPMNMLRLMQATDLPNPVTDYILKLIEVKREAGELGTSGTTDADCDALITGELESARKWLSTAPKPSQTDLKVASSINQKYSYLAGD